MRSAEPLPGPDHHVIQGRRVGFPVVVRHASAGSATYLVPIAAARALLPGPELEVAEALPGKALLSLASGRETPRTTPLR